MQKSIIPALVAVLILVAAVCLAGCTSTAAPVATPTATPIPTTLPPPVTTKAVCYIDPLTGSCHAPTPTPTPEPTLPGDTYSGYKDDVVFITVPESGVFLVTTVHRGEGNCYIWLKDSEGYKTALLANDIDSFNSRKTVRIERGTYIIEVTAGGAWAINLQRI